MFASIRGLFPPNSSLQITESLLLGGHGVPWPQYQGVADAVVAFVLQTRGPGFAGL